jgi:hypothetical protein
MPGVGVGGVGIGVTGMGDVGVGWVGAVSPAVGGGTGVAGRPSVPCWGGVGSMVSPLHSRNVPHDPQNVAPASFDVPQFLQMITGP